MGIKTFNPYTPSRRAMTQLDNAEITKSTPEKSLTVSLNKTAGRNNQGKITVRHHGGGSRRKYRIIDFKRNKVDVPATVKSIEYDPNRTANIALICYADGEKSYIIAPNGLKVGDVLMNGENAEVKVGNCLPLSAIPVGTEIHNVELYPYYAYVLLYQCLQDRVLRFQLYRLLHDIRLELISFLLKEVLMLHTFLL